MKTQWKYFLNISKFSLAKKLLNLVSSSLALLVVESLKTRYKIYAWFVDFQQDCGTK